MSYIDSVNVGGTSYKIQETVYITPSLSSSAYTANLSNFTLATGATVQAKFSATNPENATLNVNSTGAKEIHYNGAKITASQFKANHVYTLVYDGTQWQVVGDIDTQRGIENSLTSDSTSVSLSAAQGKALKGLIDAMDATTPAASGNATAFIDSITQTDGKITSITKKNIPTVSSSTAGLAPKGEAVSSQSQSTKFLRSDGHWVAPSYTVIQGTAGDNLISNLYLSAYGGSIVSYDSLKHEYTMSPTADKASGVTGLTIANNKVYIPWGYNFILSCEIYSTVAASFSYDENTALESGYTGNHSSNDWYNNHKGSSTSIPANTWTKVWYSHSNTDETKNPNHGGIWEYSYFGIIINDNTKNKQFKIRNVYGYFGTDTSAYYHHNSFEGIKNITRSGTTFTATRLDGSTFTFSQQDSDTKSFTITANATDGLWDLTGTNGTNAVTYSLAPYSAKGSAASFYTAATNPTLTTRLNYDGYLYATKLYSGGSEVLTAHRTYTAFTGNPTENQTPGFGSTFTIQQISQDTTGKITGTDRTVTIPSTAASATTAGLVNTEAQTFAGVKIFDNGIHVYGTISTQGTSSVAGTMYPGGAYHSGHNSIVLHGDTAGVSGIGFTSEKATKAGTTTNINGSSDRAFIQYHAHGVTAAAEGTAPTLATSGEHGTLVIGVGNDGGSTSEDFLLLQVPGNTGLKHQIGNTAYPIPHTTNTNGTVGSGTQPVWVDGGVIKNTTYTLGKSVPSDAVFTDTNKYHKTGSWGGTNNLTYTAAAVNSADTLAFTLATASTSVYGATKLSSAVDSTSEALAATPKAVKIAYDQATTALNTANNLLATADALVFKGTLSDVTKVPSNGYSAGWTYKITADGTYAGIVCEVGDLLIATTDATDGQTEINNAHWTVVQENINGYIHYFNNHDNNIDSLITMPYLQTAALNGGNWSGTKPTGSHNGVALFNFQTHNGNYYTQLALDTNQNRLWLRSANNATTFGNWAKIATIADIEALDANLNSTTPGAGKTLTAFSQTDGKVSATFGNISITKSQISDFGHTHPWSEITSQPTLTNVSFTAATDNAEYPILIKNSTGTITTAAGVKFPSTTGKEITINPSLGRISAAELNVTPTAYMGFNISSGNPRQSRRLTEHNTNSYRHWIILLLPYQTATNTSINNFIDGNIYLKKSGSNIYDKVYISANLCYNALQYVLNTVSGTFTPISCTYNGVKYFALKCYDHDNPWTEIWFDGYCISSYPGGNNTTTKPLTLPYMVNYKGNGSSGGSQTIVNTEVNNSISTTLTDSIVTSVTRHNWTMDINGSATKDGSGNTITNKYFQIYNTSYQGNSSSVTVNDLASQGPAYGMINNRTDNPIGSATWVHVLNMGWAKSNSSWIGQIALHTDGSTMYFRGNSSSAIAGKAWNTVLSSNNYEDYAAKTDGTNATGTWPINISGTVSWANTEHPDTFPPSAHTHNESNITWSNNTLYPIGDDIYIGDVNQAGHLGLKSHQAGNTGLAFIKQATADDTTTSVPANTSMGKITWDGTKFSITSDTAIDATTTTATNLNLMYCRDDASPSNKEVWKTIKNGKSNSKTNKVQFYTVYASNGGPTAHGEMLEILSYNANHWQPQLWFGSGRNAHLYYRNKDYNNDTWGDWLTILDSGNTTPGDGTSTSFTLAWGTEYTLGKINGTAVKIKMPNNPNSNTTYTFAEGSTDGAFSVTPSGGSAQSVPIHGLGALAYKASLSYSDVDAAPSSTVSCTTANVKSALGTDTSTTNKWLNQKGEWSTPTAAQVGAAPSSTVSCTAANIESALGIDFITNTGALNTNGWKTLGGRSSGAKIAISYASSSPATWNSSAYSASLVFGCNDTKGLLDLAYNTPVVTFGGASVNGSTDNDPKWYFKLSGTSGKTYTFPSDSKTLAAADGSNASGAWSISIPWANTNHPDTFPPTIGTTSTTAMAGNTTVTNVAISANITTDANYPIVFATSNKDTTTAKNEGLQKSGAKFYFNPSTGTLYSTKSCIDEHVTLQWNSTDSSLDFVFA